MKGEHSKLKKYFHLIWIPWHWAFLSAVIRPEIPPTTQPEFIEWQYRCLGVWTVQVSFNPGFTVHFCFSEHDAQWVCEQYRCLGLWTIQASECMNNPGVLQYRCYCVLLFQWTRRTMGVWTGCASRRTDSTSSRSVPTTSCVCGTPTQDATL